MKVFWLLLLGCDALDVGRSLLGKRAMIVCSTDPRRTLDVADGLLRGGASVELCVPLPPIGAATTGDEQAWRLRLRLQRQGFTALMRELGYVGFIAGDYMQGDPRRSRLSWSHVGADDREALQLKLVDSDLLVWHRPPPDADAHLPEGEEAARVRMRSTLLSTLRPALRQRGLVLRRDCAVPRLRWTWLDKDK